MERDLERWRANAEVGGAALKESIGVARGVIGKYGTPPLKRALNETGLGNHPELVRLMVQVGWALARRSPFNKIPANTSD